MHKILRGFSSRSCLSAVVPLRLRTRHPFAVSAPKGASQKIEFVISCQSRNNSMGASGAYAPSPSRQLTRPGRLRAEEILLYFRTRYAALRFLFSTTRKPFCRRSTATRYATIFRATASVARLALPFCFSCSYTIASSGLFRGAIFAASIRIVCRCLLRCFDSGVRMVIWPNSSPRRTVRSS